MASSQQIVPFTGPSVPLSSSQLTIFPPPPNLPTQPLEWPPEFHAAIRRAFSFAWAPSTQRNYSTGITKFLNYCRRHNVHASLIFPANEFLLCAFIAGLLDSFSPSTIKNILSGLRAWHQAYGATFPHSDRLLTIARTQIHPNTFRKPLRKPVTIQMLTSLVTHVDLCDPLDISVLACALTAFWGLFRLGELLPSSSATPAASLPSWANISQLANESLLIHIPWSKTTKWNGADIYIAPQRKPVDPISALHFHRKFNQNQDSDKLFTYRPSGSLIPSTLSKQAFLQRCNQIWSLDQIPFTTGHSFRIGGAAHLLSVGVNPDIVRTLGRWSSDSFLRYWRDQSLIIPNHVRFLPLGASQGPPLAAASAFLGGDPSVGQN